MMNGFVSKNQSSNVTRIYVFIPVDLRVRIALYSFVAICGFYAIFANGMVLYLKKEQGRQRKRKTRKIAFNRFLVTNSFITSLAVSDLMSAVTSLPLAVATNFVDIIDTDMKCKAVRFCNIFFSVVTINNLFVIGMERYLAVFHPFRVPSPREVKMLVSGAWIVGGIITLIPSITFNLQEHDLGPDRYTIDCHHNNSVPIYRVMFLGFTVLIYVIPAIVLSYTNSCILLRLRRRKKTTRINSRRFYGTSAFVALIFTFLIPYLLFVVFSGINTVLKLDLSFTTDYIIRRTSAVLVYSNAAISPTIVLFSFRDLRAMLTNLISKRITRKINVAPRTVLDDVKERNRVNAFQLNANIERLDVSQLTDRNSNSNVESISTSNS